jgi:4-hydroxythreonine-4-phosphate dehydrogenase
MTDEEESRAVPGEAPQARSGRGLPRVIISAGDPGGVGPEVVTAALADPRVSAAVRPTVVGDLAVLRAAAALRGIDLDEDDLIHMRSPAAGSFRTGDIAAANGEASFAYVRRALDEVLAGSADAVVTAPISKAAWHRAGHRYPGHTEYVAERAGAGPPAMMLCAGPLRSVLVTGHVPLREAIARVSPGGVRRAIELGHHAVTRLVGTDRPRVGVAGLNPHAGEAGILGDEDERLIRPAVEDARAGGVDVSGPHPADALYRRAAAGDFDLVVAMYHDQGLIPVKVFGRGVNVTLGTGIVRTSPDHGTAFDIAGQGVADAESMVLAILMAASLSRSADRGRW